LHRLHQAIGDQQADPPYLLCSPTLCNSTPPAIVGWTWPSLGL
jgi:hypothetical protein